MTSEIRTNSIKSRTGLSTVSYADTGIIVSGIVTATSFSGDGTNLTGITGTTINDNAVNRIITGSNTANTLNGQSLLTFSSGSGILSLTGDIHVSGEVAIAENIVHTGDGNTTIGFPANDTIAFTTGGYERLRIASEGGHKITCAESYYAANLTECNTGQLALNINKTRQGQTKGIAFGAIGNSGTDTGIQCYDTSDNSANPLLLNPFGGNIGIGEDDPVQKVHLYDASNDPYVRIQRGTTSNVDVGGIQFTSANTVFATIGSRVTSHSGGRGAVYIQTQEGSGTKREPFRVVANSGGFGERLASQGSGVCLFGTTGTHGNQFKDGRPELNNVYEESQSANRSNNGAAGGTFVVTGTGSNAATTYYPVTFTLHQQFPHVLTINKYVHNYSTWDGTLMFRADISGTGYGGHSALHRVTTNYQSGKTFIGRIRFTSHNNAYLVLWMLGGGRSYNWGTIGSGVQIVHVYDDGNSHNLGPGNTSEGPITSADTIDTGYEPNMNDSPSHQQTGFT